jgi:4-hydroxyphenylacetate 3-monooxygenase
MGARTGQQYLERLGASAATVQIEGETLTGGIAEHPAFSGVARSYAELYDMQHDPALRDLMTYPGGPGEDPYGTSFLVPRTLDDLVKRRLAGKQWADHSLGTLGRTGDYVNACLMAMSGATAWFAQADPAFAENARRYYEHVRNHDLLMTHTLVTPQANRSQDAAQQMGGALAARIVARDSGGVVIHGARMLATIGPIADELLVMPSTVLKGTADDAAYSFALAVPCDAPGLRFICRESFDAGRSHWDHPLGSRFDEPDAVVIFENVHVPFERCFLLGHPELCNTIYAGTGAGVHMTHQVATRTTAKTEAILGLVSLLAQSIGIEKFQHVQEQIAEVVVALEIVRSLVHAAETQGALNEFGVMTPKWEPLNAARNWYPRLYGRFPEILRTFGASGLMAIPTQADVEGAVRHDVERYYQSAALDGPERVRLFRLAWDLSLSSFAGRQTLYEYFFFGDPVRMAGALVGSYDREPYTERIRAFLARP